jgi:hypothetical protein
VFHATKLAGAFATFVPGMRSLEFIRYFCEAGILNLSIVKKRDTIDVLASHPPPLVIGKLEVFALELSTPVTEEPMAMPNRTLEVRGKSTTTGRPPVRITDRT